MNDALGPPRSMRNALGVLTLLVTLGGGCDGALDGGVTRDDDLRHLDDWGGLMELSYGVGMPPSARSEDTVASIRWTATVENGPPRTGPWHQIRPYQVGHPRKWSLPATDGAVVQLRAELRMTAPDRTFVVEETRAIARGELYEAHFLFAPPLHSRRPPGVAAGEPWILVETTSVGTPPTLPYGVPCSVVVDLQVFCNLGVTFGEVEDAIEPFLATGEASVLRGGEPDEPCGLGDGQPGLVLTLRDPVMGLALRYRLYELAIETGLVTDWWGSEPHCEGIGRLY